MARVFKKITKKRDPQTGAIHRINSKKWYIEYTNEYGKKVREAVATDKSLAQKILSRRLQEIELKKLGEYDSLEEHRNKFLLEHLEDYRDYQISDNVTQKHAHQVHDRAKKIIEGCGFKYCRELDELPVQKFIHQMQQDGLSPQTCNHYLRAVKQFSAWMMKKGRVSVDKLKELKAKNTKMDRRHDRRALSSEECKLLCHAARNGKPIENIPGKEREIIYLLSQMTGLRRNEISSLTMMSFNFDENQSTVLISANHSKNRKEAIIPLNDEVADQLQIWMKAQIIQQRNQPIFNLKTTSGNLRDTAKMMKHDLKVARKIWIKKAATKQEKIDREASDFLKYKNEAGLYADFHSNRHTFITKLCQANIHPKTAQELARHSTLAITMGTYTHIEEQQKREAVEKISYQGSLKKQSHKVSVLGPQGVPNGVKPESVAVSSCPQNSKEEATKSEDDKEKHPSPNPKQCKEIDPKWPAHSPNGTLMPEVKNEVHPEGLEPPTLGSEDISGVSYALTTLRKPLFL